MNRPRILTHHYNPLTAGMDGGTMVERFLADVGGCFHDRAACEAALAAGNPQIYKVTAIEPASGKGDLHYGLGILFPGKIGDEYFLTKGHFHSTREAAEVYIGLGGEGLMLLEEETTGHSRLEPLGAGRVVYVPGHTAHRTINTGREPLTYFGVYPANAGHDYGAMAERNFRMVVVERDGQPTMIERSKINP